MAKRFLCDVMFTTESVLQLPTGEVYTIPPGTKVLAGTRAAWGLELRTLEEHLYTPEDDHPVGS